MPIATFSRHVIFAGNNFGVLPHVDTTILVHIATLHPPSRLHPVLRFPRGRP
jgi:hypothetical protein